MKQINDSHANTHAQTRTQAKPLYVLIACEESQAECLAFRNLGHIAYSCDIQKCKRGGHPEWHIWQDVTPLLHGETTFQTQDGCTVQVPRWDLMICHPPCTYLCKVSSVHMISYDEESPGSTWFWSSEREAWVNSLRLRLMKKARAFFFECLNAKAPYVAVENPLPMAMANLPQPSCFACPSWFGERYTKKTLYWLKNLPPLMQTIEHPHPKGFVRSSRGKYRSRTFPKLAEALAKQWSEYILDDICIGKNQIY